MKININELNAGHVVKLKDVAQRYSWGMLTHGELEHFVETLAGGEVEPQAYRALTQSYVVNLGANAWLLPNDEFESIEIVEGGVDRE